MKKTLDMSTPKDNLRSVMRKRKPGDVIFRQLRDYFLYSKLRSLLPPQNLEFSDNGRSSEMVIEYEPPREEIPSVDFDEENVHTPSPIAESNAIKQDQEGKEEEEEEEDEEEEEEEEEEGEKQQEDDEDDDVACECDFAGDNDNDGDNVDASEKAFVPSIKMKRIMDNALLITTVVLKEAALSSALFLLLEDEKLDIVFENQYRTETKVSHTIQVRVPVEYNTNALEMKLQAWARSGTHT